MNQNPAAYTNSKKSVEDTANPDIKELENGH